MYQKRCGILMMIWLMITAVFGTLQVSAEDEELELYARSAVLMDGNSGRILYGKEADTELPMASTTKIMTCILALEQAEEDQICTVSQHAAAQPKVKLGMRAEDQFYLEDLLYSLMLESHNDTAVCIAENLGGSVEKFAERMNEKAREIGCSQTYYITPNGLDAEDENGTHHTTARELAWILRYCLMQSPKKEEFLKITGTASRTFTNVEGNCSYTCTNHNTLLTILDGAVSGKTGFTGNAGYCYVGAVKNGDDLLIVALLACGWPNHKGYKWADTKKLIRYGKENFRSAELIDTTIKSDAAVVKNGQKTQVETKIDWEHGETQVLADRILLREGEQVEVKIDVIQEIDAPVKTGDPAGKALLLVNGEIYAEYPVVAAEQVERLDFTYCLIKVLEKFFL